jgi:hypothetical protein
VEVRRPQWVSGARATPEGWQLRGKRGQEGMFDAVIIAHNGKCANRLTAPMGVPQLHSQLRRLKLSANWVLMAAFSSPVPVPGGMEGAFVGGSPLLSWAANQTAKLGPAGSSSGGGGGGSSSSSGAECWTLISTQAYGRGKKVPQVPRGRGHRGLLAAGGLRAERGWSLWQLPAFYQLPACLPPPHHLPSSYAHPFLCRCRRTCFPRWLSE